MTPEQTAVPERSLGTTPLRDLGLTIAGTPLEPLLRRFGEELTARGITRPVPRFYLSTEWGVPFGTVAIAIPFYLARLDLTRLHAERAGHVEGTDPDDILRYLRHEMGHVVNYAYKLYERSDWRELFGDIGRDYVDEYRPRPFSRDHVVHLPGWYAQKHPDEDWAEAFAVWMTPGEDWRRAYAAWPAALAKLEYADHVMAELRDRDPPVTDTELDEDVGELNFSLDDYYRGLDAGGADVLAGLDGALRHLFESPGGGGRRPAADLIRWLTPALQAEVFRWTGHFPERTRILLRRLARRAEELGQGYPADRETEAAVALTAFVTALAMNHVLGGDYLR
jgi:hypothetical protein